jgi:hypothetical protein
MADKHFKVKNNVQVSDLTTAGPVTVDANGVLNSHSTLAIDKGGTGQTTAANAINALLPSQTSNTSKILGTDGTNVTWVNPGASYQTSAPSNPVTGQLWVDSDETADSLDPYIIRRKTITATAGQTVFTTDVVFTDGYEQIYYNGVLLVRTTDYTTSGGTNTVTLLQGASAGDTIEIISSTPINLINTVTTNSANTITASTASSIPLKIVGASSQSADLFEILNSSNAELFAIRSNGRTKLNNLSTEADTQTLGIHANANNASSGVSVILWGKDMNDWGGDIHYLADSRGVSGAHRFWNWDGTNFLQRATLDKAGRLGVGTTTLTGKVNSTGHHNDLIANWTQAAFVGNGSYGGGFSLVDGSAGWGIRAQNAGATLAIGTAATTSPITTHLTLDNQNANFPYMNYIGSYYSSKGTRSDSVSFAAIGTGMSSNGYNYILNASNDTATRLVVFVNGTTRTADNGASSVTIRNDAGNLYLGVGGYTTYVYNRSDVSDETLKENILEYDGGLNFIKTLQPKQFNFIGNSRSQYGFVAQDITNDKVVIPGYDGNPWSVDYNSIVAALVSANKELAGRVEALENSI